jgi:ATP-binding cassette subfamily F protein uup
MDYPGTLLLVSHDRFFLDQVATHTLAWHEAGLPRWELYEGPPSTVRSLREARAAAQMAPKGDPTPAAPKPEAARPRKPGLSQKEQRRLAEVEAAMALLHGGIAELDLLLADPTAFLRPDTPGHQALKDRDAALAELELLELEWLELEGKRTES